MVNSPQWILTFCLLTLWAYIGCSDDDLAEPRMVEDLSCESPADLDCLLPYPVVQAYTLVQGNWGVQPRLDLKMVKYLAVPF